MPITFGRIALSQPAAMPVGSPPSYVSYYFNSGLHWVRLIPLLCANSRHMQCSKRVLFDHLVGGGEQCGRNFKPERLRGLYVDGELESRRLFERQVGGLRAFENAVDKGRHASEVLVE